MPDKRVAVIGECMLELSGVNSDEIHSSIKNAMPLNLSYGGDTLNTAVYLSRLGVDVQFFTALGDDIYSDWLLSQWRNEGVGCDHVRRVPDRLPGIYSIETDAEGERRFHYWRDQSPARELFDEPAIREGLFQNLLEFDVIYFSGITLSLYADSALKNFFEFLQVFRERGGLVVFDSNYRPGRWLSSQQSRAVFDCAYSSTDIALPTLEDETSLYSQDSKEQVAERLLGQGVVELVLKQGVEGSFVVNSHAQKNIPVNNLVKAIDTTAAGDSFNAGYLSGRLRGTSFEVAAKYGHDLAARVVQCAGAIIPRESMQDLIDEHPKCIH